jgi:hypothetical protein
MEAWSCSRLVAMQCSSIIPGSSARDRSYDTQRQQQKKQNVCSLGGSARSSSSRGERFISCGFLKPGQLASFKVKNKELSQQEVRAKKQVPSRLAVSSVLAEIPSEMVVSTRDSLFFFFFSVKRNFVHVSLRISFVCSFAEAL